MCSNKTFYCLKETSWRICLMVLFLLAVYCVGYCPSASAEEDTEPPVINSISLSKTLLSGGDYTVISVDMSDNLSGVASVEIGFRKVGDTSWSVYGLRYNSYYGPDGLVTTSDNMWHLTYSFNEYAPSGVYTFGTFRATDKAGNTCEYYYDDSDCPDILKNASFTIENENEDTEAPVLKSISLSKTNLSGGDYTVLSVDITDDLSGVSFVRIYFCMDNGSKSVDTQLYYNGYSTDEGYVTTTDNLWHGVLQFNEYSPSGSYSVQSFIANDAAGNLVSYRNNDDNFPDILKNVSFTVENENENGDTTAPSIQSASLSKTLLSVGDYVVLSVDVTDDLSGVADVMIGFRKQDDNGWAVNELTYNGYDGPNGYVTTTDNMWYYAYKIHEFTTPGIYSVGSFYTADKADNSYESWYNANDFPNILKSISYAVINSDTAEANLTEFAEYYFGESSTEPDSTYIDYVSAQDLQPFAKTVSGSHSSASFEGNTLIVNGSTIVLRYVFLPTSTAAPSVALDGSTVDLSYNGSYFYVDAEYSSAADYGTPHTVVVNGELTVSASPLSYAYTVLTGDAEEITPALENLAKALYLRYYAA